MIPHSLTDGYISPFTNRTSGETTLSDIERFTIVFSSHTCLFLGFQKCPKAKYFCQNNGKIEFINNSVTFDEAKESCLFKKGSLSKFCPSKIYFKIDDCNSSWIHSTYKFCFGTEIAIIYGPYYMGHHDIKWKNLKGNWSTLRHAEFWRYYTLYQDRAFYLDRFISK